MNPNSSQLIQTMRSIRPVPAYNLIAALSAATLLTACGGGGASSGVSTDSTVSLATITTGYTPAPVATTPTTTTTPVVTPVTTTPTTTGAALTDVRLESTGSAQTNMPFTFGQVFPVGALNATDGLAAKLADGTVLPLQVDVKATHANGSVRHAIISGVLPSLATGQTQTLTLYKSAAAIITFQARLSIDSSHITDQEGSEPISLRPPVVGM